MALRLKLSTILVSVLVLSTLAPIELTEAANPFSLRRLKDFLKSVVQLATSQHHNQGPNDHHHPPEHHHQHRVMPTVAIPLGKDLSQLSREELEDILEAELQEVHSRNDTNETFDNDLASNHTDYYDAENATKGYNTTESPEEGTKPEEKSKPEPEEKSKEGSKSASKSNPSKVHEEGVLGFRSRPCNHYFYGKWRKYYKYGQRGYATTEEPELSPVTEMEGTTTTEPTIPENEESEIEPATTEPSIEPIEIEPATTEPSIEEPTVTSEPVKRKSYMYVQEDRPEHHAIEVETPNKGIHIVYIPIDPNEACIFTIDNMDIKPCGFDELYYYDENCVEDKSHRIAVCDTQNSNEVCYFALEEKNVCLETIE